MELHQAAPWPQGYSLEGTIDNTEEFPKVPQGLEQMVWGAQGEKGRAVSPLWKEQDTFIEYLGPGWGVERVLRAEAVCWAKAWWKSWAPAHGLADGLKSWG